MFKCWHNELGLGRKCLDAEDHTDRVERDTARLLAEGPGLPPRDWDEAIDGPETCCCGDDDTTVRRSLAGER